MDKNSSNWENYNDIDEFDIKSIQATTDKDWQPTFDSYDAIPKKNKRPMWDPLLELQDVQEYPFPKKNWEYFGKEKYTKLNKNLELRDLLYNPDEEPIWPVIEDDFFEDEITHTEEKSEEFGQKIDI